MFPTKIEIRTGMLQLNSIAFLEIIRAIEANWHLCVFSVRCGDF